MDELLPHEQAALWLQTDAGIEWDSDNHAERAGNPVATYDTATHSLSDYIYVAVANWSNARIRGYLER